MREVLTYVLLGSSGDVILLYFFFLFTISVYSDDGAKDYKQGVEGSTNMAIMHIDQA